MNRGSAVVVRPARDLRGTLSVPGDKSITHRAMFFAALNSGVTTIINASPAEDCRRTLDIVRAIGCDVGDAGANVTIRRTDRGIAARELELDCGNSGTTARLAMGLL